MGARLTPAATMLLLVVVLGACRSRAPGAGTVQLVERARVSMGSELRLAAWAADEAAADSAFDAVFGEFERLESLMSVWRDGSDVVRVNAAAGEHAVSVSPNVREVLGVARQVSEWTDGKFDVTFGALSDLWKFDHDQDNRIPDRESVRRRLPLVDYRAIVVDERAGTVFLARKGMRIHLGGIGKGYAIGRGADILRRRGLRDFVIQSGGDLYVAGRRGDRPWRVGIRDPRGPAGQIFATVELADSAISTSGDYERFFLKDGRRYHHLLNPATGNPARECRSVTIVSGNPMLADALSTGVFILGPRAGLALVDSLAGVGAVIVTAENEMLISSRLRQQVHLLAPTTDAP